jgi:hypothetical protein
MMAQRPRSRPTQCNGLPDGLYVIYYIGVQVRKGPARPPGVSAAASCAQSRTPNNNTASTCLLASRGQGVLLTPAAKTKTLLDVRTAAPTAPGVLLLSRGRFPEGPRIDPPVCIPFASARSQHTWRPVCVWCFCRPLALFGVIAHSISSIIGPLPVFSCSGSRPFRLCSTYWVWRLRLRLPTPGLVGSPHVHSSCLAPVGFAGFLIKCLHVHWPLVHPGLSPKKGKKEEEGLPPCRFAWPIPRRLGYFRSRGAFPCVLSVTLSIFVSAAQLRCDIWHYLAVWAISSSRGVLPPVLSPLCYFPVSCLPPSSGST